MGRGARALVMTAEGRPFLDTPRAENSWLTPVGLGAFVLGTAIAVPLVGPAGLLALLVPVGMVAYSVLLADATAERARRGSVGEIAKLHVELRDANFYLREQVVGLQAATVEGARQRAHGNELELQSTVRAFIEAMAPKGEAAPE